jgi:hypothetical protein
MTDDLAEAARLAEMFGLTIPESSRRRDLKECWWYLDGTPTHSRTDGATTTRSESFGYADLVADNAPRSTASGVRAV